MWGARRSHRAASLRVTWGARACPSRGVRGAGARPWGSAAGRVRRPLPRPEAREPLSSAFPKLLAGGVLLVARAYLYGRWHESQ